MSDTEIQVNLNYHKDKKTVQAVAIGFGGNHRVDVSALNGKTMVRMVGREFDIALDATGPGCDFERAINILRLYMRT